MTIKHIELHFCCTTPNITKWRRSSSSCLSIVALFGSFAAGSSQGRRFQHPPKRLGKQTCLRLNKGFRPTTHNPQLVLRQLCSTFLLFLMARKEEDWHWSKKPITHWRISKQMLWKNIKMPLIKVWSEYQIFFGHTSDLALVWGPVLRSNQKP